MLENIAYAGILPRHMSIQENFWRRISRKILDSSKKSLIIGELWYKM